VLESEALDGARNGTSHITVHNYQDTIVDLGDDALL
jgi:hypothetical protein